MTARDTLLLVDSSNNSRVSLRNIFEDSFNILEARNCEQAMLLLEQDRGCIAAVLLDAPLLEANEYKMLCDMDRKHLLSAVPVMVIVDSDSSESEIRALDFGAADVITRPFSTSVVRRRLENIISLYHHKWHLSDLVEEKAQSLHRSNEAIMDALSTVIEQRGAKSVHHIPRIRQFTKLLLDELIRSCPEYNLDERTAQIIASAAALHDIGKVFIPDSILNKPDKLTAEEFEIAKDHALSSRHLLDCLNDLGNNEYLYYAYNICCYHHERWDGNGYPNGLAGNDIPISAQVVGLADAYDALTTSRTYRPAYSCEKAANMILNGECGMFSPQLLECFKQVRGRFAELVHAGTGDTNVHSVPSAIPPRPQLSPAELDTLQLAQAKSQALLHYLDVTVAEVDLDQGGYHLLYNPDPNLAVLRSAATFDDVLQRLAVEAVHPDDRGALLEQAHSHLREFFASGLRKQTRPYRIFNVATEDYQNYDVTLLRIDPSDFSRRNALVIWEKAGEAAQRQTAAAQGGQAAALAALLGIVQCCRNDRFLTMFGSCKGLFSLLGYTEDELREQFHNHLIELIPQKERDDIRRRITDQLAQGNNLEVEFQMQHKDGHSIWVLTKGYLLTGADGDEYLYGMMLDITQSKKAQEVLRLSLERHQIIMEQTSDIVFELDFATDTLVCSSMWEKRFGYPYISQQASVRIPTVSHFHPDDMLALEEKLYQIKHGAHYVEMEARIANAAGRYTWNRLRATVQQDQDGHPLKVIGVIIDIDSEKRKSQALQDKAERDSLTKLYNKNASRRQTEEYLASCGAREHSALLIIDLDNFKEVNDHYGHMFGDAVLVQASAEISSLFRDNDVVSRIGGDEFMVFMKNIPGRALVESRCQKLISSIQNLYRDQLTEQPLSCSIGVAFSPEHGTAFQELFQRADRALYQAKGRDKGCYVCYDLTDPSPLQHPAITKHISAEITPSLSGSDLIRYVFDHLYESGDVEATIAAALELAGKQMNVSRAYIFENDADNKACHNTFKWCNTGALPNAPHLQHISYDTDMPGYQDNFNERGIFYCPDTAKLPDPQASALKSQGVKSLLQCAIRDQGEFCGFVGFDECAVNRLWTQEEIDLLSFLSQMLSLFLLKKRTQDRTASLAKDLRSVLDGQPDKVYVVDSNSWRLHFLNARMQAAAPEARPGMRCYEALMGQKHPCTGCPVENLRNDESPTISQQHLISLGEAAPILWSGRNACLITRRDAPEHTP